MLQCNHENSILFKVQLLVGCSVIGLSLFATWLYWKTKKRPIALDPKNKIPFELVGKEVFILCFLSCS